MNPLAEAVREALESREPRHITNGSFRHAAVLIPLVAETGSFRVVLTRRTDRVEHHKGQISFPGGMVDETDETFLHTALREAWEEVGIQRSDVEVLGRIDDAFTVVTDFVVHPFVGVIPADYPFTVNPKEVDEVIVVPLDVFHPSHFETEHPVEYEGEIYESPAYEYNGHLVWGATARMMSVLMEIIADRLPLSETGK